MSKIILGAMVVSLLVVVRPVRAGEAPGALTKAGDIAKDPSAYYGRFVTVKAEVEDIYGAQMFTLDEDQVLVGPDLLVLVPYGQVAEVRDNERLVVGGVVRPYSEAAFERDFDFFDHGKLVDVDTRVEWNTRPVIIASSVQSATRNVMLSKAPETPSGSATTWTSVDATELARNPSRYYGLKVLVTGEVADAISPTMFTLDEDAVLLGPDVLVLFPKGIRLADDQDVTVVGTVRRFVERDLDRDFDFFDDGKLVIMKTTVDWKDRPVVIADSVVKRPVAAR